MGKPLERRSPMFLMNRERRSGQMREQQGFTLLEVMVSVTLISIALVALIGSQSRSVSIATGSRFETTASFLARAKMTELLLGDFEELGSGEGDFGEDFPGYRWRTEVRDLGADETGIEGLEDELKVVVLTLSSSFEEDQTFVLQEIFMAPIAQGAGK